MPKPFPIVIASLALLGAGLPASAEEGLPKRGTTYTTDGDVSQYRQQPNRSRTQIFILRGSEAKASQKDPGVVIDAPPEATKEPPKMKRGFRKRGSVPAE